jgi:ABC-type branched-subunit amino acid transport system ATPase component
VCRLHARSPDVGSAYFLEGSGKSLQVLIHVLGRSNKEPGCVLLYKRAILKVEADALENVLLAVVHEQPRVFAQLASR